MLTITDGDTLARALRARLDLRLKHLLIDRRDQLDGRIEGEVRFIVVQPGDALATLERELGFSIFQNVVDGSRFGEPGFTPSWEWIAYHGHCFELCFIFDDSGFAHVLFVPKFPTINADLIEFCRQYASA